MTWNKLWGMMMLGLGICLGLAMIGTFFIPNGEVWGQILVIPFILNTLVGSVLLKMEKLK